MPDKPILVVDFDGVLHSYTSGWQGPTVINDPPVPGATAFLKEAVKHFDVHVFSSRSNEEGGIDAMRRELSWWLIDELYPGGEKVFAEIKFPTKKPPAFLTIDDRCICFNGTFPDMDTLWNFKPWNKK
jgi:hypothetical protein